MLRCLDKREIGVGDEATSPISSRVSPFLLLFSLSVVSPSLSAHSRFPIMREGKKEKEEKEGRGEQSSFSRVLFLHPSQHTAGISALVHGMSTCV